MPRRRAERDGDRGWSFADSRPGPASRTPGGTTPRHGRQPVGFRGRALRTVRPRRLPRTEAAPRRRPRRRGGRGIGLEGRNEERPPVHGEDRRAGMGADRRAVPGGKRRSRFGERPAPGEQAPPDGGRSGAAEPIQPGPARFAGLPDVRFSLHGELARARRPGVRSGRSATHGRTKATRYVGNPSRTAQERNTFPGSPGPGFPRRPIPYPKPCPPPRVTVPFSPLRRRSSS